MKWPLESKKKKRRAAVGRWLNLADTYDSMARGLKFNGNEKVPRATLYQGIATIYRTCAGEMIDYK